MNNSKYILTSLLMVLAVGIGAFGAHGLKPHLDAYGLEIFKTASFYHFIHGIGMFVLLGIAQQMTPKKLKISFYSFLVGIILFSGSLYILALRSAFPSIPGWLGAITPFGGLSFIIGWSAIGLNFFSKKEK